MIPHQKNGCPVFFAVSRLSFTMSATILRSCTLIAYASLYVTPPRMYQQSFNSSCFKFFTSFSMSCK